MIRLVYLHGPLGEKYGTDPLEFQADTVHQLISALKIFCQGFETELRKYSQICIVKKRGNEISGVPQEELGIGFGNWDELHINASVTAAGVETFAAWVASYAGSYYSLAYVAAYIVYSIAVSYALSYIVQSMQDTITTEKAKAENASTLFNGPENRIGQGARVQLNYGRFRVGSVTLNQNMTSVRQPLTANDNISLLTTDASSSINVFSNDLFSIAPVVTNFVINGTTTAAGGTYSGIAGVTVNITAAGVCTVTPTSETANSFSITVNATDSGTAINQSIAVDVSIPQEQYWNLGGTGTNVSGDNDGGGPAGDGGDGDAAGVGSAGA